MTKTLVGLYDTYVESNHVIKALLEQGFARHDISLAVHSSDNTGDGSADYTYRTPETSTGRGRELVDLLMKSGVPQSEADSYAEGVRRGGALILVKSDDEQSDRGIEIMKQGHLVDIDERRSQWQQEGWDRFDPDADPYAETDVNVERERYEKRTADKGETRIPIVEEELTVGKREVESGQVRVHVHSEELPVEEEVRLRQESVTVERHPVDRQATEADLSEAFREETMEFTETREEAIVSKRARVVEEVTIQQEAEEHTETIQDTVRHTQVDVDQENRRAEAPVRSGATHDADFRQHYTSTFAGEDGDYSDYEPAYHYGSTLGADKRYRSRDWAALESDARHGWESRHAGTWDRYRDAIRYGWDKTHA